MCYDRVCPMFGDVLLFEFWGDPVGVWEGAWSGLPVEVATHLARIAQREGGTEGGRHRNRPSSSTDLFLFLGGPL